MKTLSWCWTLVFIAWTVVDFGSDVLLRSGKDDHAWDVQYGLVMVIWIIIMIALAVDAVIEEVRKADDRLDNKYKS